MNIFKNKQFTKFLPVYMIILSLVLLLGTSYALLRSNHTGTNSYTMNVGLLQVDFFGTTNNLTVSNMLPMSDEDGLAQNDALEFTVKNTGQLLAGYNVYIEETSTSPEFKSVIKYAVNKDNAGYGSALSLNNNMLYIDQNQYLESGSTANYKVKIWLKEDATSTYMNKSFTAKVVITSNQVTGELASTKITNRYNGEGQDGLYAVNTDGDLYNGTGTIREYRYSGATPKNYIYFNGNELWRIVGVFNGELKIVKDTALANVTLTNNQYTHTETSTTFYLKNDEQTWGSRLYWNKHVDTNQTNNNDWTTAGLQYYLNDTDNSNSYYYNIDSAYKGLIKTNTTYYLGNVTILTNGLAFPTKTIYEQERGTVECEVGVTSDSHSNSCNIWNGNQPDWEGAIGLLYVSDHGYANATNLWGYNLNTYSAKDFKHNNWILDPNATVGTYWLLSPSSYDSTYAMNLRYDGYVTHNKVNVNRGARPALNLISSARIYSGDGTSSNPYKLLT